MDRGSVSPLRKPSARRRASVDRTPRVDEQRVQDMLSEGGGVVLPRVLLTKPVPEAAPTDAGRTAAGLTDAPEDPSTKRGIGSFLGEGAKAPERLVAAFDDKLKAWGKGRLEELVQRKGRVSRSMQGVPQQMHLVASQTQLVLELIDDFRAGIYREVSWRSMALLVGGLLYTVSPADVIPDMIPVLGKLDDLTVLAVVTRSTNRELRAYCRFKGYPESKYFRQP